MKTVYISGPISSPSKAKILQNIERFNIKEKELVDAGLQVFNPASNGIEDKTWEQYLAKDILKLCTCDIIYLLKGWKKSRGARLEYEIARLRGMEIVEEQ